MTREYIKRKNSRPICCVCNITAGRIVGRYKDGSTKYGKRCSTCHHARYETTYRADKKDKCDMCGFIPKHKCQLDVDHIDGNHNNNNKDNLQTLCANCHRLKTFLNNDGWYVNKSGIT